MCKNRSAKVVHHSVGELAQYEFMIVFSSFLCNATFYSSMDLGQLINPYSQLASFSPARTLTIDTLVSTYENLTVLVESQLHGSQLHVPSELSGVVTLFMGNSVLELFVRECIAGCRWKGYESMGLGTFPTAETMSSRALKYMAIVKESKQRRGPIRAIVSLAITGWMVKLSDSECTCGTWAQAFDLVLYFVPDQVQSTRRGLNECLHLHPVGPKLPSERRAQSGS